MLILGLVYENMSGRKGRGGRAKGPSGHPSPSSSSANALLTEASVRALDQKSRNDAAALQYSLKQWANDSTSSPACTLAPTVSLSLPLYLILDFTRIPVSLILFMLAEQSCVGVVCQALRDSLVPQFCLQWIRLHPNHRLIGAYAARVYVVRVWCLPLSLLCADVLCCFCSLLGFSLELSISPSSAAAALGPPLLLPMGEGTRLVATLEEPWSLFSQRLASKDTTWSEKHSLSMFIGQLLTMYAPPLLLVRWGVF